ncbi:MAG: extracellular solute-binding protein [Eubacteriales bacterium]
MKRRFLSVLLAATMVASLFSGCGITTTDSTTEVAEEVVEEAVVEEVAEEAVEEASEGEQITLTYMGWLDNNEDALRAVADLYEAANPNVTIEIELLESDQYETVYMARMASGEAADLMSIRYQAADKENYAAGDYVVDLSGEVACSYMNEGLDQINAYEGVIQGLPVAADCWGVWYNEDILAELGLEIPSTIGEFMDACQAAKDAGYTPIANGLQDGWTAWMTLWTLWGKAGEEDITLFENFQVGDATLSDVEAVAWAYEQAKEYYDLGYYPDNVLGTSQDSAVEMWYNGEALFCPNGTFFLPEVEAANPDFSYGFMKQPYNEEEQDDICAQGGFTFSIAAYKGGANEEAAVDFINFFFTPENYQVYVDVSETIGTTVQGTSGGDSDAALDINAAITSMNANLHPGDAQQVALDGLAAVFAGVMTPEEVVAEMDQELLNSLTK